MVMMKLLKNLNDNAKLYYVGGYVRDHVLGRQPTDVDMVGFGVTINELANSLVNLGIYPKYANERNKPFLSFMLNDKRHEISVADSNMETDLLSRDLTMNAMYMDIESGNIIDPLNGQKDIENKTLRAVGPTFKRDPRRVLRVWNAVSRFGFEPDATLLRFSHQLYDVKDDVSNEVWGKEFLGVINGKYPDLAMEFLRRSGWIKATPFWNIQVDFNQKNIYHEEDLWNHTLMVTKAAAQHEPKFVAAALFHDTGKPSTQHIKDTGYANYHGHEEVSAEIAEETLKSWGIEHGFVDEVVELIREHMSLYGETNDRTLRRLTSRLKYNTLNDILIHAQCDKIGRIPASNMDDKIPLINTFIEKESNKFVPLLQGRDVIALGIEPGEEVGKILRAAKSAQLDGIFSSHQEAIKWLHHYLERPGKRNRVRVYLDLTHDEVERILIDNKIQPTQENVSILKANIRFLVTKQFTPEYIKEIYTQ